MPSDVVRLDVHGAFRLRMTKNSTTAMIAAISRYPIGPRPGWLGRRQRRRGGTWLRGGRRSRGLSRGCRGRHGGSRRCLGAADGRLHFLFRHDHWGRFRDDRRCKRVALMQFADANHATVLEDLDAALVQLVLTEALPALRRHPARSPSAVRRSTRSRREIR